MVRPADKRLGGAFASLAIAAALVLACMLGGCSPEPKGPDAGVRSPVETVDELLRLRAERSVDASAYAELVTDSQVAIDLAASAKAEREATVSPTPEWEPPYETSRDAEMVHVVVVWEPDADHPAWPPATVFVVETRDGRWMVADAVPVDPGDPAPPRLE